MTRTARVTALLAVSGLAMATLGACASSTGSTEDFCTDYDAFANGDFFANITDVTDMAQNLGAIDAMVKAAKQILPPEEIAAAWSTVFQTTEDQAVAMRGVDWSDPAEVASYVDVMEKYDNPELDQAEAEVQAFVAANCGQ